MNIRERQEYFTAILVYKCLHELAPDCICKTLHFVKDSHNYSTRMSNDMSLTLPHPNLSSFKRTFMYNGPYVWNKLPHSIRMSESLFAFKTRCKDFIGQ